jgi:hypothetical protein
MKKIFKWALLGVAFCLATIAIISVYSKHNIKSFCRDLKIGSTLEEVTRNASASGMSISGGGLTEDQAAYLYHANSGYGGWQCDLVFQGARLKVRYLINIRSYNWETEHF